jgi:hypothetical protein
MHWLADHWLACAGSVKMMMMIANYNLLSKRSQPSFLPSNPHLFKCLAQ